MVNQTGSGGLLPADDRFNQLQLELKRAIEEGGLTDDDPIVKNLLLDFFKENTDVVSYIAGHDGKISAIISQLDQLGITEKKINEFISIIFKLQKGEATAPSPIPSITFEEPVTLEFFCDIDSRDHNGSILEPVCWAIKDESPFITTRTLFRASHIKVDRNKKKDLRDELMTGIEERFDIYTNGAFLVFVPKKLGKELSAQERFEKLDLDSEALEKITLEEAWSQTDEKATIVGYKKLFSDNPKHDKLVYIEGHGGVGRPAGLTAEHYNEFLEWAKSNRCRGLLVSSCCIGGKSAMLHHPQKESRNIPRFQSEPPKKVTFPVFVRSIGDFPSFGGQEAEKNVGSLFSKIAALLNSPGGRTVFRLRQVLQEHEKGKPKKDTQNLLQVLYESDSPVGFRPVGEGGESSSITYLRYRKHQIDEGYIRVSNKAFVEVSPGFIECPIVVDGKSPVLLSLIPGTAHHLLKEVKLEGIHPKDFLLNNAAFYKRADVGVTKAFFMFGLKSDDKEFNQVFVDMESGECGYREDDRYYLWNVNKKDDPVQVTPLQFLFRWKSTVANSCPDAEALRVATGGNQDNQEILNTLNQEAFWGDHKGDFDRYQTLFQEERIKEISLEELQVLIAPLHLTDAEMTGLLSYLLLRNEGLACSLFQQLELSADSEDERGVPLIIHASQNNCVDFVKVLCKKGANINLPDPITLNTCLRYAFYNKDPKLLEFLLAQDSIDLRVKNERGNPVFLRAIFYPEDLKKCLEKDPHLDLNTIVKNRSGESRSLLGAAVEGGGSDCVEFLLKSKAKPNGMGGKTLPLALAIISGDRDKINLLLKYGANPFVRDKEGNYPIVEAIHRSSLDVVAQLLKEKIPEMEQEERKALLESIFLEAIVSGEESKIRLVLRMDPTFPESLEFSQEEALEKGLNRLHLFKKDDFIQEIISRIGEGNAEAGKAISSWCLDEAPHMLERLMDASWNLPDIINQIIHKDNLSREVQVRCIKKAQELGADLNQSPVEGSVVSHVGTALKYENLELARFLIENRADPRPASEEIVGTGNIELIKLAMEKGLLLESKDPSQPSLLNQIGSFDLSREDMRETFKWLVARGADVNALYEESTPFFEVVASGSKDLYDFCLEHGATKAPEDKGVFSKLLAHAAKSKTPGGEQIIKDLVEKGADLNASEPGIYITPFSAIVHYGSLDIVTWCLDHRAVVSPENPSLNFLPLQAAGIRDDQEASEIFKLLVSRGGDLNQQGYCYYYLQNFPLLSVIENGNLELLKFCFDEGAELKDAEIKEKAFIEAIESGNPELVTEIKSRGYTFSINGWDWDKAATMLNRAYNTGGSAMLEKAISFDPIPKAVQEAGKKLLRDIIRENDIKALQLLEKKGVKFEENNKMIFEQDKFFDYFSFQGIKGTDVILKIIGRLEKGKLTNILNRNLKVILQKKNTELLKFALDHGADPNTRTEEYFGEGRNMIFEAIETGKPEIVKLFLDADVNLSVTYENQTPSGFARSQGNPEIIKLLCG